MVLKDSPYVIAYYDDDSVEILFSKNEKGIATLNLDRDNRYKLAMDLLQPYMYEPKMENFIVSQCQSQ